MDKCKCRSSRRQRQHEHITRLKYSVWSNYKTFGGKSAVSGSSRISPYLKTLHPMKTSRWGSGSNTSSRTSSAPVKYYPKYIYNVSGEAGSAAASRQTMNSFTRAKTNPCQFSVICTRKRGCNSRTVKTEADRKSIYVQLCVRAGNAGSTK